MTTRTLLFQIFFLSACWPSSSLSMVKRKSSVQKFAVSMSTKTSRRALLGGGAAVAGLALGTASEKAWGLGSNDAVYAPAAGSLAGKTILITGANTGLGLESAIRLRRAGANVIVTARSAGKVEQTVATLSSDAQASAAPGRVVGVELDLANLKSIKAFPERLVEATSKTQAIDVLMNNAGVMAIPERMSTADGFERTIGVNHLGHFALTAALLPFLERAPSGFRVLTVSSEAHKFVTKNQVEAALQNGRLELDGGYSSMGSYGLSKVSNVLFTEELQKRLEERGIKGSAVALHPGVVQTDLARYIIGGKDAGDVRLSEVKAPPSGIGKVLKESVLDKVLLPIDRGANTQVYLAAAADTGGDLAAKGALYFDAMAPAQASNAATDPSLARKLWELSESLTGFNLLE